MAKMGLKVCGWAKMKTEPDDAVPTYEAGKIIGKMVSLNATIKNAEGELYADDKLAEYLSEFDSGDLSMETDNIGLEDQADLYGATYTEETKTLAMKPNDTPPYGQFAGYRVLMINGAKTFRAFRYVKVRCQIPDVTDNTRGNSISFGTQPIKGKIMAPNFGAWYEEIDCESDAAALTQVKTWLGVAVA